MASCIDSTTFEISQITEDCEDLFDGYTPRISKLSPEEAELFYAQRKAQIQSLLKSKGRVRTPSSMITPTPTHSNLYHNITDTFPSTTSQRKTSHKRFVTHTDAYEDLPCQMRDSTPHSHTRNTSHKISRESARSSSPRHIPLQFEKVARHDVTSMSNKCQQRHLKKRNSAKMESVSKSSYDIYEPIYARTAKWKEVKLEELENMKKTKECAELQECTFVPKTNGASSSGVVYSINLDLYERGMLSKENLKSKTEEILGKRKERELDNCTFKPKTNEAIEEKVDPDAIYDRQMQWRKQIEEKMQSMKLEQIHKYAKKTKPVKAIKQQSTFSIVSCNEIKKEALDREEFEMRYKRLSSMIDSLNFQIEESLK
jgi:hypothetical protein